MYIILNFILKILLFILKIKFNLIYSQAALMDKFWNCNIVPRYHLM